jgi:hypothetical protein
VLTDSGRVPESSLAVVQLGTDELASRRIGCGLPGHAKPAHDALRYEKYGQRQEWRKVLNSDRIPDISRPDEPDAMTSAKLV